MADQAQATTRGPRARPAPRTREPIDPSKPRETESNILFVAGFPQDTDAQVVGTFFEKFGAVKHVRLSRGVGRVEFEGDDSANKSLALNGTDYEGGKLRVELHFKRRPYVRRPRAEGDRPPRAPRAEGDRPPRAPRAEGAARPPRAPRAEGAAHPPRAPRAEGAARPPRAPRAEGDRPPRVARAPAAATEPAELKPLNPNKVFAGRIYPTTEDSVIQAAFAVFGTVVNYERSRSRRFALITYGSAAEAEKAVATGVSINDFALRLEAENPNKATRRPRVEGDRPPRERKPVDPATLDAKRLYFGYLPENTIPSTITAIYAGTTDLVLRGKYGYVTFDTEASAKFALDNPQKLGAEVKIEVAERTIRPRRVRQPIA